LGGFFNNAILQRKANTGGYRPPGKVRDAVPTSRMKAERMQRGAEFVDATVVFKKRSSDESIRRQRTTSSQ